MEQFEAMLIYFITVYLKYWFTCESTIYAPKNDLDFLKELEEFSQIEGKYFSLIGRSAKFTQLRHMDYVTEENAIFSIFDERISVEEKENLRVKLLTSNSQDQFAKLSTIDPSVSFCSDDLEDSEFQIYTMSAVDENTEDLVKLIDTADQMLSEKNFIEVDENAKFCNSEHITRKLTNVDFVVLKSPFDYITLQSLKTLVNYGINISFMLFHSAQWASQKSFINALEKAKNIQSTSIYTEQLVGQISRLNNSNIIKNKENLNNLALCAVEKETK